jgi:NAD(P)-dependent dehydrogenase (short-subunit alcohol dehydrogenase family)
VPFFARSVRRRRAVPPGRAVLITGAASGIGAAAARIAVADGHRVVIADIDVDAAKSLAAELAPQASAVELDVRDAHSWSQAFDAAEAEFGPVEVLINNAGIIHTGHARTLTVQQHRDVVEVNLLGPITGVRTALDRMGVSRPGHIITVCSMTSFLPLPGYATYAGTKHALRAFHHSVAIEERRGPLTFSIIHPPSTRTPMLAKEMADPTMAVAFAEKAHSPEAVARVIIDAIAGKPVEVVFPPVAGRLQRLAGSWPRVTHVAIPIVESAGRRNRERLMRQGTA